MSFSGLLLKTATLKSKRGQDPHPADAANSWSRLRQSKERVSQRIVTGQASVEETGKSAGYINPEKPLTRNQTDSVGKNSSAVAADPADGKNRNSRKKTTESSRSAQPTATNNKQDEDPLSRLLAAKNRKKR